MDLVTVITSAATGSLVTVLAQPVGQAFERRSRRREHVLSLAFEITQARIKACREPNSIDPLLETERCFNALGFLIDDGVIPPEERTKTNSLQRMRMRRKLRETARTGLEERGWDRGGPMWRKVMQLIDDKTNAAPVDDDQAPTSAPMTVVRKGP